MLLSSQITNAQLDCTTSNVAVYRATLDVTNGENCTQLIAILQDWISTSPSLVVQSVRIRIASYCEVEFDIQSDCMNPSDNGTRPTTGTQATEQTPSGESEGSIKYDRDYRRVSGGRWCCLVTHSHPAHNLLCVYRQDIQDQQDTVSCYCNFFLNRHPQTLLSSHSAIMN